MFINSTVSSILFDHQSIQTHTLIFERAFFDECWSSCFNFCFIDSLTCRIWFLTSDYLFPKYFPQKRKFGNSEWSFQSCVNWIFFFKERLSHQRQLLLKLSLADSSADTSFTLIFCFIFSSSDAPLTLLLANLQIFRCFCSIYELPNKTFELSFQFSFIWKNYKAAVYSKQILKEKGFCKFFFQTE